ncbi:MAG: diguanylate cyclase [Actinobacteria bacterium]|nr:diguanylate cyclase [Actinomycetota bacterium]
MTRLRKAQPSTGRSVLLVDDDAVYLSSVGRLLKHEGHEVLCASSGAEALEILRRRPVDLVLLDYFMPGMTGGELVAEIRTFDPLVQVILQTGYASERPARHMLHELDIQGYHDKSEGPEKLLLWTDVGLRAAYSTQLLDKSRRALRHILDITPELHRIQPLDDLLQGLLWQVAGILGACNSFLAVRNLDAGKTDADKLLDGFVALNEDDELLVKAGTGEFRWASSVRECLSGAKLALVQDALRAGTLTVAGGSSAVPLQVGEETKGVIYLDRPALSAEDAMLLEVFANQAAVAIHNVCLYEMATLDPLTGVYTRRFFQQFLLREARISLRSRQPLSLLLVDVDALKHVNDTYGHAAGDEVLRSVGKALRQATRSTDVVGRSGGDEFGLVLPDTHEEGSGEVARRLLDALAGQTTQLYGIELQPTVSLGSAVLQLPEGMEADGSVSGETLEQVVAALMHTADEALYEAKRAGGSCLRAAAPDHSSPSSASPQGDGDGQADPPQAEQEGEGGCELSTDRDVARGIPA